MARAKELSKDERDQLKDLTSHPGWQLVLNEVHRRRESHKTSALGAKSMEDLHEFRGRHDEVAKLAEWVNTEAYKDVKAAG